MPNAFIIGLAGAHLTDDERRFIRDARPAGVILFGRNCVQLEQVRALVAEFRSAVDYDALVLIDQEGGRVQRLRPPLGRRLPAAADFAVLHAQDAEAGCRAAFLTSRLAASELAALGINTNCAPVLDVNAPGAHDVIGDRAYGNTPEGVVTLGEAVAHGLMAGGILPVMKHIPGHGRATADSHLELPVVAASRAELERVDFAPFKALAQLPAAMTAHVVYTDIDPDAPASISATVTREVIRGCIGFEGLLMSDDLSMRALTGSFAERAAAVLRAGSDLALHCNGDLREMEQVASGARTLEGASRARLDAALAVTRANSGFDVAEAEAALQRVLAYTA